MLDETSTLPRPHAGPWLLFTGTTILFTLFGWFIWQDTRHDIPDTGVYAIIAALWLNQIWPGWEAEDTSTESVTEA